MTSPDKRPHRARTLVRTLLWSAWLATMTGLIYAAFVVGQLSEAVRYGIS